MALKIIIKICLLLLFLGSVNKARSCRNAWFIMESIGAGLLLLATFLELIFEPMRGSIAHPDATMQAWIISKLIMIEIGYIIFCTGYFAGTIKKRAF